MKQHLLVSRKLKTVEIRNGYKQGTSQANHYNSNQCCADRINKQLLLVMMMLLLLLLLLFYTQQYKESLIILLLHTCCCIFIIILFHCNLLHFFSAKGSKLIWLPLPLRIYSNFSYGFQTLPTLLFANIRTVNALLYDTVNCV